MRQGPVAVKNYCHDWRAHALEPSKVKGIVPSPRNRNVKNLFIASTLSRALFFAQDYRFEQAQEETEQFWLSPPPVITRLTRSRVTDFVRRHSNGTGKLWPAPIPGLTASLEHSRRLGGVEATVAETYAQVMHTRKTSRLLGPPPKSATTPGVPWGDPETRFDPHTRVKQAVERKALKPGQLLQSLVVDELRPDPVQAIDACRSDTLSFVDRPPPIRTLPLNELGGKIRVASIHPGTLAHLGRVYNRRLIPILTRMRAHKWTLWGKPVRLQGKKGALLYSADLSKATDRIDHQLAKQVLETIAYCQNWSPEDRKAASVLVSPMRLPDGRVTSRGIHMGLGTSWTILSLMNSWAASANPVGSYQICGDDLIALWDQEQVHRYEARLKDIGLVSNTSKAFYGHHGVYCEQLVAIDPRNKNSTIASSLPLLRLAEAFGSRQRFGITDSPLAVREGLAQRLSEPMPKALERLVKQTLGRGVPKNLPRAPISIGGDGRSPRSSPEALLPLLAVYLRSGPISRDRSEQLPTMVKLNREVRSLASKRCPQGVTWEDLRSAALVGLASLGQRPKPTPLSERTLLRVSKHRRKVGTALLARTSLESLLAESRFINATGKHKVKFLLGRSTGTSPLHHPPTLRRVIKICMTHRPTPRISVQEADTLLRQHGIPQPMWQNGDQRPWFEKTEAP
jgi:hypothetical protein